jgi:transglutaminase-like putative cysteine protease
MKYHITHRTIYEYAVPVAVSHHVARLEPLATPAQTPENFSLKIFPQPVLRKERSDYFGNHLCFFSVQENHQHLEIAATSHVTIRPKPVPEPEDSPVWEEVAKLFCDPVAPEVIGPYQFVFDSPQVYASFDLADYARESFKTGTPLLAGALDLTRRIFKDFKYDSKATTVATPLEEVWEKRRGVCQDFAHLSIACLRSIGLSARYVSGYLRTRPAEGKEKLVGADASHAWFSIFCPRHGWNDFDPTNNLQVSEEHIAIAYGRDFGDVSPVAGILTGGGQHEVKVSVDVEEIA